jgi:hypothetical protein
MQKWRGCWIRRGFVILLALSLIGCRHASESTPGLAPIMPAARLLLEVDAFPPGWTTNQCEPDCTTMEHPGQAVRLFYRPHEVGVVVQNVYRYQTVAQAEQEYRRYRATQFNRSDGAMSTDFTVPSDSFRSSFADENYLACGVSTGATCRYVARYQHYMIYSVFDMESWQGYSEESHDDGLSLPALNTILDAQDARIAEQLQLAQGR